MTNREQLEVLLSRLHSPEYDAYSDEAWERWKAETPGYIEAGILRLEAMLWGHRG